MATLIGRILRKHMPFFASFATGLGRHIRHEFYEEMCAKSGVVRHKMYVYMYYTCTYYSKLEHSGIHVHVHVHACTEIEEMVNAMSNM